MCQAFACLQETARSGGRAGLGWGRFGISVRAQIELALVMSTLPLPLIFLSFTCEYICSFLRQRIGLRLIAYMFMLYDNTALYGQLSIDL